METRNLKITKQQAKALLESNPGLAGMVYNLFPELKGTVEKWGDLGTIYGWHVDRSSEIKETAKDLAANNYHQNVFATKKQAESVLAYAMLTQLMKATGDCEGIDWNDATTAKFCIGLEGNELRIRKHFINTQFLPFNTCEVAEKFLENHRELINQFYQR